MNLLIRKLIPKKLVIKRRELSIQQHAKRIKYQNIHNIHQTIKTITIQAEKFNELQSGAAWSLYTIMLGNHADFATKRSL
jgi:hypothetical protein